MDRHQQKKKLGPKGLIKQQEFVRIIAQSLYSLGFRNSAASLELESGIPFKSVKLTCLETLIKTANWDDCVNFLRGLEGFPDEDRASALFLISRQRIWECLNGGDEARALAVLRKQMEALGVGRERESVHRLGLEVVFPREGDVARLRGELLQEVERLLPVPVTVPEGRLEHLVEMAVEGQLVGCVYHNSPEEVSLFKDHRCGRDRIPTNTIQVLTDHKNEVWFVQFSHNGQYLASSSSDCTAIIWKVPEDGKLTMKHMLQSHQKPVSYVAWSPDDTMLLTCGNGEVLKLWDVETGACKYTFGNLGFTISSCAWFPDSKRLVCGSSDVEKGIHMWDCEGNELKAWRGSRMPKVLDLAVTPDGEHLISIFSDKDIRLLNLTTNNERVISEQHPITSLSVSADSELLIVNLNSQEIHMWDVAGKWAKPLKYRGHKQDKYVIRSCFGGLKSTFIASGSENSQVYIWNRRNPNPIEVLSGHSMTVNCVSWNPKRPQMLASASDDQTIRIWGPGLSDGAERQEINML